MRIIRTVLMIIGAVATLAAAGVVAAVVFFSMYKPPVPDKTVLTLDLDRNVVEYGSGKLTPWSAFGKAGPELWEIVAAIERAAADERVVGLAARVGSSSMGLARIQELRDAIRTFRRSGKPAYAFAESFGEFGPGNGAFYLAAAFEKIYLLPSGDVGLTGLLAQSYFLKGALDKLDVKYSLEQREEYKGIKEMFAEDGFTAAQRAALTRILESLTEQLTAGIAGGRGLSHAAVGDLMLRAPFSAQDALAAKLVDGLHYRDEVDDLIRERLGADVAFLPLSRYRRRLEEKDGDATTVALIYGLGQVHRGRSRYRTLAGENSMGSDSVARAFRRAADDDDVRAIIFRVDSPGGSYVASDVIWREVRQARKKGKPVIVSMGNVAGSGGYFVAAPADRIVAQPATLTGSIGVAAGKLVTRGLWDKLGVSWDQVAGNTNATFWSTLQDYDPDQRNRLGHLLDVAYDDFVSKVAQGRKLSREEVRAVAKGRVWTGADAREKGLVDELGGYAATLRAVREAAGLEPDAAIRLRLFPRRESTLRLLVEELTGYGNSEIEFPEPHLIRGIVERFGLLANRPRSRQFDGHRNVLEMPLPARLR
ncbi:MAG: signal peptide peptidase SppA [Deltaproteobacteria bacterium]|nr:signal peptide peptidase SppA [Deltaproteobacteria bacterium]